MAITLQTTYSKKVGLPNYSSHGITVTVSREIRDHAQIPDMVHQTHQTLQASVDKELQQVGWLPGQELALAPVHSNGNNGTSPRSALQQKPAFQSWNCSQKQQSLIQRVAREQGLSHEDLNTLAQARFRKDITETNRLEASGLIDELLDAQRQPAGTSNGRNGVGTNGRNGR